MNDLIRKLKDSGLIKSSENLASNPKRKPGKIEDVFTGSWHYRKNGDVYIVRDLIPYGSHHGNISFTKNISPLVLYEMDEIDEGLANNLDSIAFFDIETSNLSLGAGSFVFLIGLCYFSKDGVETELLFIDHPGAELGLLEKFNMEISRFEILGSYNGKSFDDPFIRNRLAFYHDKPHTQGKYHLDLLTYARRLWKLRLDGCKLSDIEKDILNFERESAEIPGWLVPQVYFDYLSQKDARMLEGILYHNKADVLSLAALFQHISVLLFESTEEKVPDIRDNFSLAKLYFIRSDYEKALEYYKKCVDMAYNQFIPDKLFLNYGLLLKKLGRIEEAVKIWENSKPNPDIHTCIELSKYYEHVEKKYNIAHKWAKKAKALMSINQDFYLNNQKYLVRIDHRLSRINRKRKR